MNGREYEQGKENGLWISLRRMYRVLDLKRGIIASEINKLNNDLIALTETKKKG